ncbi:hypothetical protein ARMGADRAFT_1034189 [Armillaria gallica]|uniref:Uncharacterized protein n=1 Tax=Armillaria gallica TaxID=47427 RepID=A0A2H3DJ00_ARMGA|nr:hypothetical protein ARMGADRAFT_1034189 [Armillaria gallica]
MCNLLSTTEGIEAVARFLAEPGAFTKTGNPRKKNQSRVNKKDKKTTDRIVKASPEPVTGPSPLIYSFLLPVDTNFIKRNDKRDQKKGYVEFHLVATQSIE